MQLLDVAGVHRLQLGRQRRRRTATPRRSELLRNDVADTLHVLRSSSGALESVNHRILGSNLSIGLPRMDVLGSTGIEFHNRLTRTPPGLKLPQTRADAPKVVMTRRPWKPAAGCEYVRQLKIWAGDPPVRELAKRLGVAPSTLSDLLRKTDKLPNFESLCDFLTGCGVTDANVVREWLFAWRRIKLNDYRAPRQLRQRRRSV